MAVKILDYGFKFRVKNEKHSKQLQETFFRYGFKWSTGDTTISCTNTPFLYIDNINNINSITWGGDFLNYFEKIKAKEMTLEQFINFMEKIKDCYTIFGEKIKICKEK